MQFKIHIKCLDLPVADWLVRVRDRFNYGNFFSSFSLTVAIPIASHGKVQMVNSSWPIQMKWLADGENVRASQTWITTNWAVHYDTITIRTSWPKYMENDTHTNSISRDLLKRLNRHQRTRRCIREPINRLICSCIHQHIIMAIITIIIITIVHRRPNI